MTREHTPAPWKVATSIENDFIGVFPDTGESEFAICKMPDFIKREVNEANAHLIAAAPDLLIALRGAERIIAREFPNGQGIIDIRAAIAKAEGK